MNKRTCNHRHRAGESRCNHSAGCRCQQPRQPSRIIRRKDTGPDLAPGLIAVMQHLGGHVTVRGGAVYS